jgi:hypothetical protein
MSDMFDRFEVIDVFDMSDVLDMFDMVNMFDMFNVLIWSMCSICSPRLVGRTGRSRTGSHTRGQGGAYLPIALRLCARFARVGYILPECIKENAGWLVGLLGVNQGRAFGGLW